jgi:hypothetical protein
MRLCPLDFRGCANDEQRGNIGREPFTNAQRFSARRYNNIYMLGNRYRAAISVKDEKHVRDISTPGTVYHSPKLQLCSFTPKESAQKVIGDATEKMSVVPGWSLTYSSDYLIPCMIFTTSIHSSNAGEPRNTTHALQIPCSLTCLTLFHVMLPAIAIILHI